MSEIERLRAIKWRLENNYPLLPGEAEILAELIDEHEKTREALREIVNDPLIQVLALLGSPVEEKA